MKVVQIVPTFAYGDAIGNDTLALKNALIEAGYHTEICAETIVKPYDGDVAKKIDELECSKDDVAILHLSTGAKINMDFAELPCSKIVRYHNVTPAEYFAPYDTYMARISQWALRSTRFLADKVDYCITDSEFNKTDLQRMGYRCRIDVLSVLIPFSDYEKEPDGEIVERYKDVPVVLFTGRIAPNKKIEDVISAFSVYKKYYNTNAVLILAGSYKNEDIYYKCLQKYTEQIKAKDVVFTGHIKFNQILAYYHVADIFLCQSEHEGFCVPLVEAMYFGVPIVAYQSTAIPYTLGGAGVLMDTKDPVLVAAMMNRIDKDLNLRNAVIANEKERLKQFSYENVSCQFFKYMDEFIKDRTQR